MSTTSVQTEVRTAPIYTARFRTRDIGGLTTLVTAVNQSCQTDGLTLHLKNGVSRVLDSARKTEDLSSLLDRLTLFLQRCLVQDPLFDEQNFEPITIPLLGSDGELYDEYILSLFYPSCPQDMLHCSPFGEEDFSVEPHEAAKACLQWLTARGENLENPIYRIEYERLYNANRMIPLPDGNNEFVRETLWQTLQTVFNADEELEALREQRASMEASEAEYQANLESIVSSSNASHQERMQLIQEAIDLARETSEQMVAQNAILMARISAVEGGNIVIEQRRDQLIEAQQEQDVVLSQLNQQLDQIDEAYQEAKKQACKKRTMIYIATAINVAVSAATGGLSGLFMGVCKEAGKFAISKGVSALVRDKTFASFLTGAFTGGAFTNPAVAGEVLKVSEVTLGAMKGGSLSLVDIISQRALGSVGAGAIHGLAAQHLSTPDANLRQRSSAAVLGTLGGGIGEITGVTADLSITGKPGEQKLNLQTRVS